MKRIRIKGLVSLMNRTRKQLVNGIPASEIPAFRQMVLDTTAFVEQICRENRVALSDLPAPSRRAYEYLKRIDLNNLPVRGERDVKPVSSIRISNIVSSCKMIQREFAEVARVKVAGRGEDEDLEKMLSALRQYITELAAMVDEACEKVGATPDRLPSPTLRAYQWLKFLSDQGNFQEHFQTLTRAYRILQDGHIELFNISGLYRSKMLKDIRQVAFNEGFVGAPPPIIEDLMAAVISKKGGAHKARIRQYAETEEFRETVLTIEMIGLHLQERTRGEVYDLEDVYRRVNKRYFKGKIEKPILTWNKIITHAKFGHYVPATNTIMVSIALDARDVPLYVLDYVMHHELLHKKLGVRMVNGRRMAHTAKFKAEEQSFDQYHEAQAFLAKLSLETRNH